MFRYFKKYRVMKLETSSARKRKSSPSSRAHNSRLKFESLEPRWVLDSVAGLDNPLYSTPLVSNLASGAGAETAATVSAPRQMEYLDRGMIAVNEGGGTVYVSWRLLGTDPGDIAFNLYRSTGGAAAVKLNGTPLTVTTDYVDTGVNTALSNSYFVRPVISGVEQAASETYALAADAPALPYLSIPLNIPAGGTTPDGVNYTYSANDCSVGDLDGDGQYEIIVKWDPSNSKDNSQSGYTGDVYIDAYKLNGTQLWRIDLGKNIRAGAHYTQMIVYDLDGDGKAEIALKTAPGTVDGLGNNVILPGDDPTADYRNSSGYILTGPEYLTIFEGTTGRALATTYYLPARGNVSDWGDNYGNRCDRFLAAVAYLDGSSPSLIECRGYYGPQSGYASKNIIGAWNWRNGTLTHLWTFEAAVGEDGNINSAYVGQGDHALSIADVDGDGKDEIIYGAAVIDDNGAPIYTTGLGHGDAMHVGDFDPSRPGLEVWEVHETPNASDGFELHDAATGAIIWGGGTTTDDGRGCCDNIIAGTVGAQMWSAANGNLYDVHGNVVGTAPSSDNFLVWWDGDLSRELEDGTSITKYSTSGTTTLLTATGCASNNGTKSTPCLVADLFGDWREEVVWRTANSTELRIYTTTIPSTTRIYTLMDDLQYRESIAWQNVAYNQPAHTSFYLGYGMSAPPTPNIYLAQFTPNPPPVPVNVVATVITPSRIDVTWSASQDATIYRIKRSTSAGGTFNTIGFAASGTSFSDTDVEVSGTYYYIVTALNDSGESADSPVIIGSVTGLPAPTGFTATVVSSSQVDLSWTASPGADSYLIRRAFNSGGPYTIIASGVTSAAYSDTTVLSGGTYYYVVAAVSATNGSPNSAEAPVSMPLISPWVARDIGSVGVAGHTIYSNGVFQVTGSTAGSGDGFQFAYQELVGDCTIIARVDSQTAATGWGGIMLRNSNSPTSRYVSMVATSDSKLHIFLNYRSSDGGSVKYSTGYQAVPIWFKLTRVGDVFTGYYGTDGATWTKLGSSQTISMNSYILGGLGVCSNSSALSTTTQFSNVYVTSSNTAPTVVEPAAVLPDPVTGTTANLSVSGVDDGALENLTYTWSATGPAPVGYGVNGANTANNTVATFSKYGNYSFLVTLKDAGGLTATSSVSVTVDQTLTSITITPAGATLNENQTQQFTAAAYDQFGAALIVQPDFTWDKVSGVGTLSADGLYTAPAAAGSAGITAASGSIVGSAEVTVNNAAPTVAMAAAASPIPGSNVAMNLNVLGDDDGGEENLTYTWSATGPAPVIFSVNGANAAKNTIAIFKKAGNYTFQVTIMDAGGLTATSSVSVMQFITETIFQPPEQSDPTNNWPINFAVVFNYPVADFTGDDVTLSGTAGATLAIVTPIDADGGIRYDLAVSGMTGSGTVIASIPAGSIHDSNGNPNTASTNNDNCVTFIVNGSPTFKLTGPNSGTYAPGQPITIGWTANNISGDKVISLCLDKDARLWNGNERWIEIDKVPAANCNGSYTIDPGNFLPGTYYIGGYMYDKTSWTFTESHAAAPITIPPPAFTITGPASGTYAPGQPVTITWTADNVSANDVISLCLDRDAKLWNGNERWIEIDNKPAVNGPGSYTFDPGNFLPGTYYIGGYVYDKKLWTFTESHAPAPITVPAPTFKLTGPASGSYAPGQSVSITWTAANVSGNSVIS
ncbi:MAG: hypothetical protein ABSG67_14290, partial [Thermoguttaceae bacterium]